MPLINCETKLILAWFKNCAVLSSTKRDAIAATELRAGSVSDAKRATNVSATISIFQITDTKLYAVVVTKILFEQLSAGIKRIIKWNKYRSEMNNRT